MSSTRTPTSPAESSGRLATARSLATDAACAQVVSAWREQGIESILLKGATTAEWLYEHEPRGYVDADLLVNLESVMAAAAVLERLGFAPFEEHVSEHAHPWLRRSDGAVVDLHITLWGATCSPEGVWTELQAWVEPHRIGSVTVRALSAPARALHLAIHAAQHRDSPARRADLRRALERTTIEQWREAERLAERLYALPMMGVGLDLEPAGRELLAHLPLARAGMIAHTARAPLAIGFARVAAARGLPAKVSVLLTAVRPADPRGFPARLAWLAAGLPRTVSGMRRARRHHRSARR